MQEEYEGAGYEKQFSTNDLTIAAADLSLLYT